MSGDTGDPIDDLVGEDLDIADEIKLLVAACGRNLGDGAVPLGRFDVDPGSFELTGEEPQGDGRVRYTFRCTGWLSGPDPVEGEPAPEPSLFGGEPAGESRLEAEGVPLEGSIVVTPDLEIAVEEGEIPFGPWSVLSPDRWDEWDTRNLGADPEGRWARDRTRRERLEAGQGDEGRIYRLLMACLANSGSTDVEEIHEVPSGRLPLQDTLGRPDPASFEIVSTEPVGEDRTAYEVRLDVELPGPPGRRARDPDDVDELVAWLTDGLPDDARLDDVRTRDRVRGRVVLDDDLDPVRDADGHVRAALTVERSLEDGVEEVPLEVRPPTDWRTADLDLLPADWLGWPDLDPEVAETVAGRIRACLGHQVGGSGHLGTYHIEALAVTGAEEVRPGVTRYTFQADTWVETEFMGPVTEDDPGPPMQTTTGWIDLDGDLRLTYDEAGRVRFSPGRVMHPRFWQDPDDWDRDWDLPRPEALAGEVADEIEMGYNPRVWSADDDAFQERLAETVVERGIALVVPGRDADRDAFVEAMEDLAGDLDGDVEVIDEHLRILHAIARRRSGDGD